MADFNTWKQESLVKFAFEASQMIADKQMEIAALQEDLKDCMKAYRELNATLEEA